MGLGLTGFWVLINPKRVIGFIPMYGCEPITDAAAACAAAARAQSGQQMLAGGGGGPPAAVPAAGGAAVSQARERVVGEREKVKE